MIAVGEIDSKAYIDRQIRFLSGIAKPWAYDYITNLEQSAGFVAFEQAKRYAAFRSYSAHGRYHAFTQWNAIAGIAKGFPPSLPV